MAYSVGDTVSLMSGSPLMTVRQYDEESRVVTVDWIDQQGHRQQETFYEDQLQPDDGISPIG